MTSRAAPSMYYSTMAAALQRANAELQNLALHDPLTKLPNRTLLEDRIEQASAMCKRAGSACAVLFADLGRFKAVNDSFGHAAGDELLRMAAKRLRSVVRMEDTVCRLGADEFVILLRNIGQCEDALAVARKVIQALSAPVSLRGHELRVAPSVGVSVYPLHGESAEALIANAEAALYQVKKTGRNDVRLFAPEMRSCVPARLALECDLRDAIGRQELELHYQPKVDVRSGHTTGMEALARWRHPRKGLLPPFEFIPLAEETGLIVPLGQWVLHEACRQNKAWQDEGLSPLRGHELRVAPSVGVSVYPLHGESAEALIANAEAALYQVKKTGRNDVRLFAPEMRSCVPARLALECDLRDAIGRQELELHYQPKVDVRSGHTTGMEALARWRHPRKGLLPPFEFIPLAEETGLIVPLGQWVLHEACRQNKAWQDEGLSPLRVAVNISASQLQQRDLVESITAVLQESGLGPEWLELEITESVVMHNAAEAICVLGRLKQMGIHISIDDFGTGYSSLSYLRRFPLNTLKIDASFIQDVSGDNNDGAIVQAIVGLAHSLNLVVVAEGVENEAQLRFVQASGSDQYQGFLRSKPLPALDFGRLLALAA